jgi:hypothetical protein
MQRQYGKLEHAGHCQRLSLAAQPYSVGRSGSHTHPLLRKITLKITLKPLQEYL